MDNLDDLAAKDGREIMAELPRGAFGVPNAYVYLDDLDRLCVRPLAGGGWLGVDCAKVHGVLDLGNLPRHSRFDYTPDKATAYAYVDADRGRLMVTMPTTGWVGCDLNDVRGDWAPDAGG